MVSHTSENRLSHRCRIRTAGVRTFDIRTLVSFALLSLSYCWHSHCWLRTGVVRTFVFRTLVGISMTSECVRTDSILPRGAGLEHGLCKQSIFSLSIFGFLVELLSF